MNKFEESLVTQFVKLGCSQQNAAATYQVLLELTEVRRLFDVNYHFDTTMKRMYLTGKNSKSEQESLFFPICSFENVSFAMMKQIIELNNSLSSYLAIISSDSTCVYYQVSSGLIEFTPSLPASKLNLTVKHDNEISQNRDEILQLVNKSVSNECTQVNR